MKQTPSPVDPVPSEPMRAKAKRAQAAPEPLSNEAAHQLALETEREARRQAEVGRAVRGGG